MNSCGTISTGKLRAPQALLFCIVFAGATSVSGCSDEHINRATIVNDVFCDGQSVSVILTGTTSVGNRPPVADAGGYLVSETKDSWLIRWPLHSGNEMVGKPDERYLGKHVYEAAEQGTKTVREDGIDPWNYLIVNDPSVVMIRGKNFAVLENGRKTETSNRVYEESPKRFIFSRDRRHVFSWLPEPAIYALPDLELVKKIDLSDSFKKIEKYFIGRDNYRAAILTNDLSYLIVDTQPGADPIFQGTDAACYHMNDDSTSIVSLNGDEASRIYDAEAIEGRIQWLVRKNPHKYYLATSQSEKIAEVTIPSKLKFVPFWHPEDDTIWFLNDIQNQYLGKDYTTEPMRLTIMRYDVANDALSENKLPPYQELRSKKPEAE